jgi:organic radical activating enzyme
MIPSTLHNTDHKKVVREMMRVGKYPAECSYCWKLEEIGDDNISHRVYKSLIYSEEDIQKIKDMPYDYNVPLKTVEISFDRVCNFARSYCNAGYSTTWAKDIKEYGPYQKFKTSGAGAYATDGSWSEVFGKNSEENPYVNAFLEWYPELSKTLDELRVTGGEPLASNNFWRFIEVLKKYPSENMRFAINSNLGLKENVLDKLIAMTHSLKIKEFDLYTSNESFGAHAEYIRDGLKYDQWKNNMCKFIENAKFRAVTIMMTINSLSLFSITEFLDDMMILKTKYAPHHPNVDINFLRWPGFMSPLSLPDEIKSKCHQKIKNWYDKNKDSRLFSVNEMTQISDLIDYIKSVGVGHKSTESDKELMYHDFKSFYTQYDKRRNKDFKKTFPELAEWYDSLIIDESIPYLEVNDGKITNYEDGEYKK